MAVNPLATPHQSEIEEQALRVFNSTPVQRTMERMREHFLADPRAETRAGRVTLEQNLHEVAFSAASCAVSMNSANPRAYWTINLPHRWFGREVPGSRHGVDNPDNIYRVVAIDDVSCYEMNGRVPAKPGPDVSFTVFSAYPGNGADSHSLGVVTLDELEVGDDGSFILTLDPEPANGRRNHLQVKPGAKLLFVRDSLHDWANESPLWLDVARRFGPAAAATSEADLAKEAAAILERAAPYWIRSMPLWFAKHPYNVVPKAGTGNFAYAKQAQTAARFRLAEDQALVITVDPMGARYFGFQLADPWGAAPDYGEHTSSLNAAQVAPNRDGTITYVISTHDPGVYNWLDTTGLEEGTLLIRWQAIPPGGIDPQRSVRFSEVVKRFELKQFLPPETRWVTPEGRRKQLSERSKAYRRRLLEDERFPTTARATNTLHDQHGDQTMTQLDAKQMIADAERETGLADWGGEDFHEPFEVLIHALNTEAELHEQGAKIAQRHLHDVLCGRLRLTADRKRFPGIPKERIKAPVFVIGLPRSGTTFLHSLLTQDPRNRSPLTWEIMFPSPPPEQASYRNDPRIAQCQVKLREIGFLGEGMRAIHPFGATRAEECNFIWEYTLRTVNYMAWWNVPTYTKLLYRTDMRPVYESHKQFLQHLQHRFQGDRWVLKTPAHMAWLDALFAVYPDACLIQCHRDPARIIPSLSNNLLEYRKLYSTLRPAGTYGMLELQANSLRKVDAFRARPEYQDRFVDAHYLDVQADPMAVMRRIYGHFAIPLSAESEAAMTAWLKRDRSDHAQGPKHSYQLEDFGVDYLEIDKHLGDYIGRYNVALER